MTTLNDTFEIELAQEDEGYKSGSQNFYIPKPLSRVPRAYHVSMVDDLSLNLANFGQSPTPPKQHAEPSPQRHRWHSLTHHHLMFTSSDDDISSDLPDIMTMTIDADIPDLDDVSDAVWFT